MALQPTVTNRSKREMGRKCVFHPSIQPKLVITCYWFSVKGIGWNYWCMVLDRSEPRNECDVIWFQFEIDLGQSAWTKLNCAPRFHSKTNEPTKSKPTYQLAFSFASSFYLVHSGNGEQEQNVSLDSDADVYDKQLKLTLECMPSQPIFF